jgi:hypothetical protein
MTWTRFSARTAARMTCGTPRCHCGWPPGRRLPRSARAGHSVHVCSPSTLTASPATARSPTTPSNTPSARKPAGTRQLIAWHRAQRVAHIWPTNPRSCRPDPSVIRPHTAIHTGTQLDPTGPAHHRLSARDLRKHPLGGRGPGWAAPARTAQGRALRRPLTCPDLAHNWPKDTVSGLPDRPRTRIRPGTQTRRALA